MTTLEVAMTQLKSHVWITVALLLLAFTATVRAQEAEKVLMIERHSYEPVQLVALRIGTQSVTDRIRMNFRVPKSKDGLDRVSFKETDDWFKRVSVTLRNTSTKPVYGLRTYLYFKHPSERMVFSVPLTLSRKLRDDPLQPGAEIEMTVSPDQMNKTIETAMVYGVDASRTEVTFLVDGVWFNEKLQWSNGTLVEPDPTTPNKWIPVDPESKKP
jgi:hypothetical protein